MVEFKTKWRRVPLTVKASTAYVVCNILQRCLSFITLPLFTRLMTTEQYGQATVYSSWQGILQIFLTLNLAYGSFSTAMVKFEEDRNGYISSVQGICILLSVFFCVIYLPFHDFWDRLLELPAYIICIMVSETVGATAMTLWSGKKRFEYKYVSVVAITIGLSIISPIVQYFLVISHDEKGYARIIGGALVNIVIGGAFLIYNFFRGRKIFHKEYWRYAVGFNVPLLVYYLSQMVFNQSDRIMISHMVGTDKAAIYGVAYSLAMMLTFVLGAINSSYVPWCYEKIKEGKEEDNRTVSIIIAAVMAMLLLAVIWFSPEVILFMAGRKYAEAVYVVPPVAISLLLLFYSQLFINIEFYYEEKKKLVWASVGAAVLNLVLNWVFIRRFGFIAAAYTTLVSYVFFAVCNYLAMRELLKERGKVDNAYNYKGLLALFAGFSVLATIGMFLYASLGMRVSVAVAVLAGMVFKRKLLIQYLRMVFRRTA